MKREVIDNNVSKRKYENFFFTSDQVFFVKVTLDKGFLNWDTEITSHIRK